MSNLDRNDDVVFSVSKHARFIAPGQEGMAKQQAYIFRDLLDKHADLKLRGGDVTDAYSLLFHGMSWTRLMANLRGTADTSYFGFQGRGSLSILARDASRLTGAPFSRTIRAILEMPRARYLSARTMAGAKLASSASGRPSWDLPDISPEDYENGFPVVVSPGDRRGWVVHFTSDPSTNDEMAWVVYENTRGGEAVPIDTIQYASDQNACEAVRDPVERWAPSFKQSKAISERVHEAAQAYHVALNQIADVCEPWQASERLGDAIEAFNDVLEDALEAFWLDTREINSFSSLQGAYGVSDRRARLMFSEACPEKTFSDLFRSQA
jgi:hypothetical protein